MLPKKSTESDNIRLRTPNFNKGHTEELDELREMFQILKTEQELLKKKLSSHKNLIRALGTPPKVQEKINSETRIRLNFTTNLSDSNSHVSRNSRKIKILKEKLDISNISPSGLGDSFVLPKLITSYTTRKIRSNNNTPIKYFRDQPILSKHQRFPRDVFVVKK